jgi:hypothetical protein
VASTSKQFIVAHAMKYPDRPDLSAFGVPACKVIYESALVTKDKKTPLPANKLQALAARLLPIVHDIETWPPRIICNSEKKVWDPEAEW